jgi:outer membrane receptor protein involved in Fe transport
MNAGLNTLTRFALAGSILALSTAEAQSPVDADAESGLMEEVVVTATRRATALQDTAMAVSAVTGAQLDAMGYTSLRDFVESVPGVTALDVGPSDMRLVIRGLSNSMIREGNPTTAQYLDEYPLNARFGSGDLKLVDLEHVEVLRGPQGSLYGKSAMGGAVRFITNKPGFDGFEGGATASLSDTRYAADLNYDLHGFVNIPFTDELALRAVAYRFREEGFIDSVPMTGLGIFAGAPDGALPGEVLYPARENVNDAEYTGGRLALRYLISDRVTLDLGWVYQRLESGGQHIVNPDSPWTDFSAIDDLLSVDPYPMFSIDDRDTHLFTASLGAAFEAFDLSVHAAHTDVETDDFNSSTLFISRSIFGIPNYDIPGVLSFRPGDQKTTTAEIRLVSNGDGPWNWIVGGYYEDSDGTDSLLGVTDRPAPDVFPFNFLFGTEAGFVGLDAVVENDYREKALYGEVGYEFSERWSASIGYRRADVSQSNVTTKNDGTFGNPAVVGIVNEAGEIANTYKFLLEFRPADDLLLFATASSGYRPGGKNPQVLGNPGKVYGSDDLWNYEIGAKGTGLDGRFTYAASLYRMDWSDMQLQVTLPGGSAEIDNVGKARIQGLELELGLLATDKLNIGVNYTYIDGELREDYNPTLDPDSGEDSLVGDEGFRGDRLPGAARNSFSAFVDWSLPLTDNIGLFARLHYRYVGSRTIDFNPGNAPALGHPNFVELPSYDITNLVLGLDVPGVARGLQLSMFADNLFDERAQVAYLDFYSNQVSVNRPRTIGIRADVRF